MSNYYEKFPKTTAKERKFHERMNTKYAFISKTVEEAKNNERGRTYRKPKDDGVSAGNN